MKTYILIIILSKVANQSGITTTSVEFNSLQACKAAELSIRDDVKRYHNKEVVSSGCYEK